MFRRLLQVKMSMRIDAAGHDIMPRGVNDFVVGALIFNRDDCLEFLFSRAIVSAGANCLPGRMWCGNGGNRVTGNHDITDEMIGGCANKTVFNNDIHKANPFCYRHRILKV